MQDLSFLESVPDFESPELLTAYDELPLWSAMFGMLLLDEVPLAGRHRVLDVGCGTGFPLIEIAERLGATAHVDGLDPWKGGLDRARAKIAARKTPNVALHLGSASAMPFPGAMFDLIVSNLGLNNFDDRRGAIRECRRVAMKGAVIALTTNLQGHMVEFYDAFERVLTTMGEGEALERLRAHIAHRATVESVEALLEDGGFRPVRVVRREGTMRFAGAAALLNHHFIRLGFLGAWKEVAAGREEVFLGLLRELDAIAATEGELRLTIPMAYVEGEF
jgi:ubiquinone/menaquinone biosynthesis C-methylase UbiE